MKRNLVIAAITAAALIGGGTYTAVAMGGDDSRGATGTATLPAPVAQLGVVSDDSGNDVLDDSRDDGDGGKDDGRDDGKDDRAPVKRQPAGGNGTGLTAGEAAAAALKEHPGAVASVERDDDGDRHWEIDLFGKDNRWHELRVDAATGAVRVDRDDDGDDDRDDDHGDDRAALRAASVDVQRAVAAALASAPGTVTSAEIDDDHDGRWEIDVRGEDGRTHELNVHATTGEVTVDRDDDGRDDHGDDDGRGGHDDRDDHDDDRYDD
ncbi:Asp-rich hydrophilic protein [Streptomyces sp. L-9-10]|uniref:PepSY domain-containing protein n=1 Tax=Streptomyces sp. L-9-10 TaxID=1478131 RepID=UPI00101CC35C|nr:PepSY domain-containing protein [Streptomyces sp. L-9-10]RYJ27693.1 Asp-rich hydrophilic protein [Streptomyces sp. L-9-10]